MQKLPRNKIYSLQEKVLLNFRSKDETRPSLLGIVHYSPLKKRVSCDGHRACFISTGYSEALKDLIIAPDYTVINTEYPKVEQVLPDPKKATRALIHFPKIFAIKSKRPTHLYFDGSKFSLERSESSILALDTNLILDFLNTDSSFNVDYIKDSDSSMTPIKIYFYQEYDDNFVVVMPLKMQ